MKLIQTLYIDDSKDPYRDGFGWKTPQFHLMSWALSCLQLNKLYGEIELYANTSAACLLIDTLGLPYKKINLTHDKLRIANQNLWALPKLYTYSLQEKPFLHIDGDVFIFQRFPNKLLECELIAQNIEVATEHYSSTQKELMAHFSYFPECVHNDFCSGIPIKAVNAGILGGNDITFIKGYANEAFEYVNRNESKLPLVNVDKFNIFFEQHLFYSLAKEKSTPIGLLFDDLVSDNKYKYLGNFHEVPFKRTYLHLLGNYKKDDFTCQQMVAKLRELFPEYYFKILKLCKEQKIKLNYHFYKNEKIESFKDFKSLQEKATIYYKNNHLEETPVVPALKDVVCKEDYPELRLLDQIYESYVKRANGTNKKLLSQDYRVFTKKLLEAIKATHWLSSYYLYGRDIDNSKWYSEIFNNEAEIFTKTLIRCPEISLIQSDYNWGGLFIKHRNMNSIYYSNLQLNRGVMSNLFVPEATVIRFSLYDLEYFEKLVLDHLCQPMTIKKLLSVLQAYVEDDVIQNHIEVYNEYIIKIIRSLVLKKALKPLSI